MTELVQNFALSGVALAKRCRTLGMPDLERIQTALDGRGSRDEASRRCRRKLRRFRMGGSA
jgi:hypothetical protein